MAIKPVYLRVSELLREEVRLQGERGKDRKLPTDRELEARYGVSRHTIGKAVALLEAEGLLTREQGRGTFIRAAAAAPSPSQVSTCKIGFIAPLVSANAQGLCFHPVVQRIMRGVEHAARTSGYRVITSVVGSHNLDEERDLFADFVAAGVRGIILHPLLRRRQDIGRDYLLHEFLDVPTVLAGGCLARLGRAQVQLDNEQLGYDVVQWLLSEGHRRIGLVVPWTADILHPAFEERIAGFRRALANAGIDPGDHWIQHNTGDGLAAALDRCLLRLEPTAIIAINDESAIDIIEQLERRGIWVPEQATVVGFDNLPEASCFEPPFPTSDPDYFRLGALAATRLLQALADGVLPSGRTVLPVPLRFRRSGRARAAFGPPRNRTEAGEQSCDMKSGR